MRCLPLLGLVQALVTPWIAAIFGSSQFSDLSFYINGSEFKYGNFLNSLLSFILVCLVCYFAVIKPLIALLNSVHGDTLATKFCPECMEKIPKVCRTAMPQSDGTLLIDLPPHRPAPAAYLTGCFT